ncbi:hypothetical protein M405DRAFT_884672 [Rhizopogon salebrosus TDB-379]|nr:hypothetical protein M405DRAFT_884672 [Rhizopogon salebrosus TDB-379]
MNVLRSRLNDIRDILDAEHVQEDLITMARSFGFKASSGWIGDTAAQYLTELVTHLGKLLEVVEMECKEQAKEVEEALANNQISFDLLEYYYEEGGVYTEYVGIGQGDLDIQRRIIPFVLKRARFSDDKKQLDLDVEYHEWDGVCFQKRVIGYVQDAYEGVQEITPLCFHRMSDETLAKVTERGRLYLSYCGLGVVYAEYYDSTRMQDQLKCSDSNVKARVRRVMIDPLGFHHAQRGYNPNQRRPLPDNAEEYIARLPYWIGGYDLETHEWQRFPISDLTPIEYDEMVWRNLIMDDNTKDLIEALVDSTGQSLGASYSGQLSKGKNVLLIGPLGTGRMTTVHAVCNLLKRPLLTISAYDIGSGTDLIAHWMSLAVTWNAVIVVKDADVYLKSANITDREHINATLRQLEGDDCITFWVTSGCDEEFLNSFCAVINFPELNATARRRLWLTHFGQPEPAGYVPKIERTLVSSSFGDQKKVDYSAHLRDIEKLSRHRLDGEPHANCWVTLLILLLGRTIENIVRSARALATSNGEHLSVHHVKVVMEARRQDNPPLWRKLTRALMLVTKVLHASGAN